ncbi:hypothetical protein JOM56_013083 [Amanita muscaria]
MSLRHMTRPNDRDPIPTDRLGTSLPPNASPPPVFAKDATPENPWHPFPNRVLWAFAWREFMEVQASEAQITQGLDILEAMSLLSSGGNTNNVPWRNVQDMYSTIDKIREGHVPWKRTYFQYTGALPPDPPRWMQEKYELCYRDLRLLLHKQLSSPDFRDLFDYVPYHLFSDAGDRYWSNLMSAEWAWKQADIICDNPANIGCMFVPVIGGSDKTTVSVATGHQEYHPHYVSPGNLTSIARRSHGKGLLPSAFLPIPKASRTERDSVTYQAFVRQLYHACLEYIYLPLLPFMTTTPDIVQCPDGHFRRVIYGIGPFIADYPEQVWLTTIVSGWCPKCDALPNQLDETKQARNHTEAITDYVIESFDPGVIWDDYGIRTDVVPFTHRFPRANIHELISPDLLHQVIKGTFKDHLVAWVCDYLTHTVSVVPSFPGIRRFKQGRDFNQWTGDDSKALMKSYIAAINGWVPSEMVQCFAAFMELCYIARRNAISSHDLTRLGNELRRFHQLRQIFIDHSVSHYPRGIQYFGSLNGLCSTITESKHIKVVKEPWRRSNRYNALSQMLTTISRGEQLSALRMLFTSNGMLTGTTTSYIKQELWREATAANIVSDNSDPDDDDSNPNIGVTPEADESQSDLTELECDKPMEDDGNMIGGVHEVSCLSSVKLASRPEPRYPRNLEPLSKYITQPRFPLVLRRFLYSILHPDYDDVGPPVSLPSFNSPIRVYHSAVARFYAPSDLCGAGGMSRETIRANPRWHKTQRYDTVFVALDDQPGMRGMVIARVLLFFSFQFRRRNFECALVNWFVREHDEPHPDTHMWEVHPELEPDGSRVLNVIHIDTIVRGAHLLPVFGEGKIPENLHFQFALDLFNSYFVNHYADHHIHELITTIS